MFFSVFSFYNPRDLNPRPSYTYLEVALFEGSRQTTGATGYTTCVTRSRPPPPQSPPPTPPPPGARPKRSSVSTTSLCGMPSPGTGREWTLTPQSFSSTSRDGPFLTRHPVRLPLSLVQYMSSDVVVLPAVVVLVSLVSRVLVSVGGGGRGAGAGSSAGVHVGPHGCGVDGVGDGGRRCCPASPAPDPPPIHTHPPLFGCFSLPKGIVEVDPDMKMFFRVSKFMNKRFGVVPPEKIRAFYDDYHRYLSSQGVDGIKVDAQSVVRSRFCCY